MRKAFVALLAGLTCVLCWAQEPGNNLGKSLSTLKSEWGDDLEYGWMEDGKSYYVSFDEDDYHKYTYYFVIESGRVCSESLMIEGTGKLPHAAYVFFLTMVKKFYSMKGWKWCDVDASILHAASVFNAQYKIEWANEFHAEFDYSNFLIYLKFEPDTKKTSISYFPL